MVPYGFAMSHVQELLRHLFCCAAQVLKDLMDRSHIASGKPGDKGSPQPYPDIGVGYEVVKQTDGAGLLAGVN